MTQKTTDSSAPLRAAAGGQSSSDHTPSALVNEAKHALVDVAGLATDQAASAVTETVGEGKDKAAQGLGTVVRALRTTGMGIGEEGDTVRGYVDQAADQVERLSSYVRDRELGEIVSDVEKLARREPALFLGGAFVLGLLGARFLKSGAAAAEGSASAVSVNGRPAGRQQQPQQQRRRELPSHGGKRYS